MAKQKGPKTRRTVGYAAVKKDVRAPKEVPLGYNEVFGAFCDAINIINRQNGLLAPYSHQAFSPVQ